MRPLNAFSGGMFRARHRRILELAGWQVRFGWPGAAGHVGVWGQRPVSARGRWVARTTGAALITVEDGFLRSVNPGASGEAPLSLVIDDLGIYYDAARPSRLERLIDAGRTDPAAPQLMARLQATGLSKYTPMSRDASAPPPRGYGLIIDQTRGDCSITGGLAREERFHEMLATARAEMPGTPLVIRTHPDCASGRKAGHFTRADLREGETLFDKPCNPWPLLEGAKRIFTISSQLGFEALIAGREVTCFGRPFYAGWGLTDDRCPGPRRGKDRSLEQLFTAAYLDYPVYYDLWRDRLTGCAETIEALALLTGRASSPERAGLVLSGFRSWKRRNALRFAARLPRKPLFRDPPEAALDAARRNGAALWVWAGKAPARILDQARTHNVKAALVEDGFIRSAGLGAGLVDAASLVVDDLGIYYDPTRPSRLEHLISTAAELPPGGPEIARAEALMAQIRTTGVSKYNIGHASAPDLPRDRKIILVPGQVEDDASIRLGTTEIADNRALLTAARQATDGFLIYKPHPDVEAGLRPGHVADAGEIADHVARNADPHTLLTRADEVWTMTSLMGFEALIRGKRVTCLGRPFYAGWGLTQDLAPVPRRTARPSLAALVWAALIAYPRYVDPLTRLPCPPEVLIERLAMGRLPAQPPGRRLLAKLQGWSAGHGLIFWR
ncbi:MAG: capsular polysaccharide biosynthesis protein [Pseudomonadota bacterium]